MLINSLFKIWLQLEDGSYGNTYHVIADTAVEALEKAYDLFDEETIEADPSLNMFMMSMVRVEDSVVI